MCAHRASSLRVGSLPFIQMKMRSIPVLVILFLSVNLLCSANECYKEEKEALLLFKDKVVVNNLWKRASEHGESFLPTWVIDTSCCGSWERIVCNPSTHHVQELHFGGLGLNATNPDFLFDLYTLHGLTYLDLSMNDLNASGLFPALAKFLKLTHIDVKGNLPLSNGYVDMQSWSSNSLQRLEYLDISNNSFTGCLPSQLGKLVSLLHLDLGGNLFTCDFHLLSQLPLLRYLNLHSLNVTTISTSTYFFPDLVYLNLSKCSLSQSRFMSINWSGINKGLKVLDLSDNMISHVNILEGFTALEQLSLQKNRIVGQVPSIIEKMSKLRELHLGSNQIGGTIPHFITDLPFLKYIYLQNNTLNGTLPISISKMQHLVALDVSSNRLSGNVASSFTLPSTLRRFSIKSNMLTGTITEVLFQHSEHLTWLDMSHNNLVINISFAWIPTFSLNWIGLGSCQIYDGTFPAWISTQPELEYLDLSNTSIYGQVPSWLWDLPPSSASLNLSSNFLQGSLQYFGHFHLIDLSYNNFSKFSHNFKGFNFRGNNEFVKLNLRNNRLKGSLPSSLGLPMMRYFDASHNLLSGMIPATFSDCHALEYLNLRNNRLKGSLPSSLGLPMMRYFDASYNLLSGMIPAAFSDCHALEFLNLDHNNLQGEFPSWIVTLNKLRFLLLSSNSLQGSIPEVIGDMPNLHFLDLSSNHFSGTIPDAITNLAPSRPQLSSVDKDDEALNDPFFSEAEFFIYLSGMELKFRIDLSNNLFFIDLSNNNFVGTIPPEIGNLQSLLCLDLSRNNLTGEIPMSMKRIQNLQALDLSSNNISGTIPAYFSEFDSLGFLNLSYNNLWGHIPRVGHMLTFDHQFFIGNPELIDPLPDPNTPSRSPSRSTPSAEHSHQNLRNISNEIDY